MFNSHLTNKTTGFPSQDLTKVGCRPIQDTFQVGPARPFDFRFQDCHGGPCFRLRVGHGNTCGEQNGTGECTKHKKTPLLLEIRAALDGAVIAARGKSS